MHDRDLEAVKAYLDATMAQDPARAARYVAPGFKAVSYTHLTLPTKA